MASRRTGTDVKATLARDEKTVPAPSNIAPAVPSYVIWKLLSFSFAMITLPISSYFFTLNHLYNGNTTFAGATAAIMANVVLIAYIIVAMKEDQSERLEEEERNKKSL
ncbi:vacuolar ATPase assembly integral membrane protein VMA21 [Delitschia confertaspora ATCC 74209]|uniref:Vacuolar ATPase assembly integral membrane protein VMA21 n=1 Tax=Delitschia confertaspora ATCC 74209 TaxID=1513339 RepID=A0A9P4JTL0_9PLEO|nr:vacuolar ATPase assembly integral membrane protein VMA21 [Delitschia confertaspora ATCC 74209]